ncbi:helix-turn-helix domain-containing protein [Deltaproteobacteria bacterium OttesenSCG-928-M10]|nr:helix-turn-helix domain-containing protein [Deltaproteobacteria bacterium OttesenSCG-928-M10]
MKNNYTNVEKEQLKKFGAHLRTVRLDCHFSQEKLADVAGLNRTYLGDVERGERNISLLNLIKLSKALKCALVELLPENL